MSQLGAPFTPPPPYEPPSLPPSRVTSSEIPGWVVGLAGLLALALAGLLAFVVIDGKGGNSQAAPPPRRAAHHYPKHWNRKIAPLARVAARQRGLSFHHPVAVHFLRPKAFVRSLLKDNGKTTKRDRRETATAESEMRALGLMTGHVDLVKASKSAQGADVLAYYSFQHKDITVRGRRLTPDTKETLVHELTHVLQDQNFRVGHKLHQLSKAKGNSSEAYDVLDAIVEGDARRMEYEYRASLSTKTQHEIAAEESRYTRGTKGELTHVPNIVLALMDAPYALGQALAQTAGAEGGNSAVNRLLRNPPGHDIALLNTARALQGDDRAAKVPAPAVPHGAKRLDHGEFGAVSLYLMLAGRLPQTRALTTADGWGGDSYVAFRQGGTTCMSLDFVGKGPAQTVRIHDALRQWAAASPGSPSVAMDGSRVAVHSCDPGPAARSGLQSFTQAVNRAGMRNQYVLSFVRAHVPVTQARCITDGIFARYPLSELSTSDFGANSPAIQERVHEIAMSCATQSGA